MCEGEGGREREREREREIIVHDYTRQKSWTFLYPFKHCDQILLFFNTKFSDCKRLSNNYTLSDVIQHFTSGTYYNCKHCITMCLFFFRGLL